MGPRPLGPIGPIFFLNHFILDFNIYFLIELHIELPIVLPIVLPIELPIELTIAVISLIKTPRMSKNKLPHSPAHPGVFCSIRTCFIDANLTYHL